MSYQPYTRSATRSSGIVFFGERGNADVLTSDSNFLLEDGAAGNIQAPNFKLADGGNIGSVTTDDAISIAGNGNVTVSNNLSITGDLTVNGTTTTVNSTVTTIEDPVIILGSGAGDGYGGTSDDNKDRGIAFAWNNNGAGNGQLGFFGHDDSIQRFVYYTSGTMTNDVFSDGVLGDAEFRWGKFTGVSGNLVGDVTGTASDATILETTRTFSITGEGTATAQNFNGSQNVELPFVLDATAITNQTAESSPDNDDIILIYDNTAGALRRQTRGQFVSGLGAGSMDSFTVTADAGTNETINDGNTLDIAGGSGIQTVVGATDTVTVNMKIDQSTLGFTTDILEVQDGGITATQLATSVAGDGLTGGGGSALAFDISDLATTDTDIGAADFIAIHDGAQKKITFANFVADIDHNSIANYVANQHIDHTTVDITAGDGLTGGGDISSTRTLTVVGDSGILVTADGVHANLVDYTVQTTAANARTTTASRTYAVQVDSSDKLVVNVPWTDTNELTTEEVQDIVGAQIATNGSHTLLTASYDDAGDGAIDLTVDNDLANYSNATSAFIDTAGNGLAKDGTTLNLDISSLGTATPAFNDLIAFEDGSVADLHQSCTFNTLAGQLAGDGLTVDASTMSLDVEVDDSTIEIATDTVQVKDAGITFAKLAAAAVVTEGEGIASNDNDTTLPTSAAVKDYVDNNAASSLKTVVTDNTTSAILSTENVSLADATSGSITLTLPAHASGRQVTVKKTDTSANTVTVTGATGNIDGAANVILYSEDESVTVISDGSNWHII